MEKNKKIQGRACFLLLLLLVLSVLSLFLLSVRQKGKVPTTACIYQDGALLREIDLSSVRKPYSFRLLSADGGYNDIYVSSEGISVSDADCPDRLCVLFGQKNTGRLPIICLPHKLAILYKEADASAPDAVTY